MFLTPVSSLNKFPYDPKTSSFNKSILDLKYNEQTPAILRSVCWMREIFAVPILTENEAYDPICANLMNLINIVAPARYNKFSILDSRSNTCNGNYLEFCKQLSECGFPLENLPKSKQVLFQSETVRILLAEAILWLQNEYEKNGIRKLDQNSTRSFYIYKKSNIGQSEKKEQREESVFDERSNQNVNFQINPNIHTKERDDLGGKISNIFWDFSTKPNKQSTQNKGNTKNPNIEKKKKKEKKKKRKKKREMEKRREKKVKNKKTIRRYSFDKDRILMSKNQTLQECQKWDFQSKRLSQSLKKYSGYQIWGIDNYPERNNKKKKKKSRNKSISSSITCDTSSVNTISTPSESSVTSSITTISEESDQNEILKILSSEENSKKEVITLNRKVFQNSINKKSKGKYSKNKKHKKKNSLRKKKKKKSKRGKETRSEKEKEKEKKIERGKGKGKENKGRRGSKGRRKKKRKEQQQQIKKNLNSIDYYLRKKRGVDKRTLKEKERKLYSNFNYNFGKGKKIRHRKQSKSQKRHKSRSKSGNRSLKSGEDTGEFYGFFDPNNSITRKQTFKHKLKSINKKDNNKKTKRGGSWKEKKRKKDKEKNKLNFANNNNHHYNQKNDKRVVACQGGERGKGKIITDSEVELKDEEFVDQSFSGMSNFYSSEDCNEETSEINRIFRFQELQEINKKKKIKNSNKNKYKNHETKLENEKERERRKKGGKYKVKGKGKNGDDYHGGRNNDISSTGNNNLNNKKAKGKSKNYNSNKKKNRSKSKKKEKKLQNFKQYIYEYDPDYLPKLKNDEYEFEIIDYLNNNSHYFNSRLGTIFKNENRNPKSIYIYEIYFLIQYLFFSNQETNQLENQVKYSQPITNTLNKKIQKSYETAKNLLKVGIIKFNIISNLKTDLTHRKAELYLKKTHLEIVYLNPYEKHRRSWSKGMSFGINKIHTGVVSLEILQRNVYDKFTFENRFEKMVAIFLMIMFILNQGRKKVIGYNPRVKEINFNFFFNSKYIPLPIHPNEKFLELYSDISIINTVTNQDSILPNYWELGGVNFLVSIAVNREYPIVSGHIKILPDKLKIGIMGNTSIKVSYTNNITTYKNPDNNKIFRLNWEKFNLKGQKREEGIICIALSNRDRKLIIQSILYFLQKWSERLNNKKGKKRKK
ncbi:hypothetical protein M0812_11755 [Anaeramoeba flamelloides]|uniref:Uncharacterized protein n=1 Tax=Anaeramoeba flamelloides TaxID=1746091 RepID=A0AAV7ZZ61_9EUKA|nr:hypothetical protein M0812_11755 [Anaeramoeba flamelloides]